MKVKELIEKLKTLDENLNVLIQPYELLSCYEADLQHLVFVPDENVNFEAEGSATLSNFDEPELVVRRMLTRLPGVKINPSLS